MIGRGGASDSVAMISVVIPTLNAEAGLVRTLTSLLEATMRGLVRDVVIADGGSTDLTRDIAEDAGCEFVEGKGTRGRLLDDGARRARGPWLLFLHPGTALEPGWDSEAWSFIRGGGDRRAATFRFALTERGWAARRTEFAYRLRNRVFSLPYGNQGLLVSKALYEAVGGFRDLTALEDVDFAARLRRVSGRSGITRFASRAMAHSRQAGMSDVRRLPLVAMYGLGISPDRLARR